MRLIRTRPGGLAGLGMELLLSAVLLGVHAAPARADGQPPALPWHQGVPEERKQKAEQLFQEGRRLHRSAILAEARTKYEEALRYWEHPELRVYLGRVLMRTGLPLLAYENLQRALQWGPGALDAQLETEVHASMSELLRQQLAVIEIRCDEPGAAVLLDGKPWFVGPGAERRLVLPGEHVVAARKMGYYAVVKPVVVLAGKRASGTLQLSADAVITERRWQAAWAPWVVVGAGGALGLLGAGLTWHANEQHNEADREFQATFRRTCQKAPACAPREGSVYDQGFLESGIAIGSFIAGGAALITGGVLVYMNGPRSRRTEDRGDVTIELAPAVSGSAAGLSARISF
ncbi:hypothetical protein SOCE26_000750 [Sorangium cellulosum]|uniref:PEGA domain-containing protein n=1 Tax=Sorangium cellulosum TaxID=56 RepID=A0A2L0EHD7_SORCE|nr:hypothetical protein [Sorangium cellulosum]AUX38697.1 hypothetical protein SOCE26_000750 [Sorangium cellulosum]